MSVVTLAWTAGCAIAMSSAIFGVLVARMVWADDLRHAQELKSSWDRQKQSYETIIGYKDQSIASHKKTINSLEQIIATLQRPK